MFELFSITHYLLLLLIPVMMYLAYCTRNIKKDHQLLFSLSFLLFIMEIFKQYYHYFILHDWSLWIFPFQLCSIPLYLWILYPYYQKKWFQSIETFLIDFTFLGALLALCYPEDMIKPQMILTIHSFLWHYLLVYISSYMYFSHHGDLSIKGYMKGNLVFTTLAFIAFLLNITLGKIDSISMFYLDPYHISTQPVFHTIGVKYGISIQLISYILTIYIVSFLFHLCIQKAKSKFS